MAAGKQAASSATGAASAIRSGEALATAEANVAQLVTKLRASRLGAGFADWVEGNWRSLIENPRLRPRVMQAGVAARQAEVVTPSQLKRLKAEPMPAEPKSSSPPSTSKALNSSRIRSAESVNTQMTENGLQPAWLKGTQVETLEVPTGTRFQMVVSEGQAMALMEGKPAFGGWASPTEIPSQAYARESLAILPEFKADVSYVVTVETTAPQTINKGFAGPLGSASGEGAQVEFLGTRSLQLIPPPKGLPVH